MIRCVVIIGIAVITVYCFMKSATDKEVQEEQHDYFEAIYRETMKELQDYN